MDPLLFFKSLADDTRLKIILLIYQESELCVCELTEALAFSQPKISRHIALMRRDGLIEDRREGKWVFYRLSGQLVSWQKQTLHECLATLSLTEKNQDTTSLTKINFNLSECVLRLNDMGNRPMRQQVCCS